MKKQSKKDAKGARKPSELAKDKTSTSRKNLDIKEKLASESRKHAFSGPGVTLSALGTEPDLPEEVVEESSAPAPEAKRKKPGRRKREEEKPETASVQREPIPLKSGPAPEDVKEGQEDALSEATPFQDAPGALKDETPTETSGEAVKETTADKTEPAEPESKFATQRESIEDLAPGEIQHFQTISDYVGPTSSLYPIVVKSQTPPSITCIEGWAMIQEAIEAGEPTIRCHIYHLAEVSVEELAIRKLAIRVLPTGGPDSYAERARNYTKCKELLIATNENLVTFAHGGARRGMTFASERERNVNLLLAARLGKSEETTRKYSLHGAYLKDEAFQDLVEGKADSKFFQSIQKVKSKLVENLKGQRVSHEDTVGRVSEAVLQMFRDENEIARISESLTRVEPPQSTSPVQAVAGQPEGTSAHEETQEQEEAGTGEEEAGGEEEEEQAGTEGTESEEPSETPALATANSESQEQQAFNDVEIRSRGIAICEELKGHLANREITLSESKERIRILIQTLDQLLAQIPDA